MIWIVYIIWLVFALVLGVVGQITQKDIYGVIALISTIVMFYVPFMV